MTSSRFYSLFPSRRITVAQIVSKVRELVGEGKVSAAQKYLSDYTTEAAKETVSTWWELLKTLIVRFNDGYDNVPKLGSMCTFPCCSDERLCVRSGESPFFSTACCSARYDWAYIDLW